MDDTSVDDPIVVKADSFPFLSHWNMLFIFYNCNFWEQLKTIIRILTIIFRMKARLVSQIMIDYCIYR